MLAGELLKDGTLLNKDVLKWPFIRDALKTAFVVKANNVQEYIRTWHPRTQMLREAFPNVAPPFDLMWVEYADPMGQKGMLLHATSRRKNPDMLVWSDEFPGREDVEWVLNNYLFMFSREYRKAVFAAHIHYGVLNDGALVWPKIPDHGEGLAIRTSEMYERMGAPEQGEDRQGIVTMALETVFMTLQFMHCKNVIVEKSPATPQRVQRKREREGKLPLMRFHTIRIDPGFSRSAGADGPGGHREHGNALHICRGHFKTFSTERPLFGRFAGTYWWPMIVRGQKQEGIIDKEYEVGRSGGEASG